MIYLLRHGDAESPARTTTRPPPDRQGRAPGARRRPGAGRRSGPRSRPAWRARRCARRRPRGWPARPLDLEPESDRELRGGGFDSLALAAGRGDVLLVGHEPDLSDEVARLTGARVKLRKGGLAIVDGSTLIALLGPVALRRDRRG